MARFVYPLRWLKGLGAHHSWMASLVFSVSRALVPQKADTPRGRTNSSSSSSLSRLESSAG